MSKDNSTKLLLASLKSGNEITVSQRDYLVIQQYAENMGLTLNIIKKEGGNITVKAA